MKNLFPCDDFQTPENVCRYMASLIPELGNMAVLLEPTRGKGNLLEAMHNEMMLRDKMYKVIAPHDFYKWNKSQKEDKIDCVVSNPPFTPMKKGYDILYSCMEMTNNIIILMPYLTIINGEKRTRDIINYGLKSITHLPRSIFKGSMVQTCILEMQRGYKFHTIFKILPYEYQK